ncbi:hypothetical protein SRHO_G00294370 [Serrasalmus rhombeus]
MRSNTPSPRNTPCTPRDVPYLAHPNHLNTGRFGLRLPFKASRAAFSRPGPRLGLAPALRARNRARKTTDARASPKRGASRPFPYPVFRRGCARPPSRAAGRSGSALC